MVDRCSYNVLQFTSSFLLRWRTISFTNGWLRIRDPVRQQTYYGSLIAQVTDQGYAIWLWVQPISAYVLVERAGQSPAYLQLRENRFTRQHDARIQTHRSQGSKEDCRNEVESYETWNAVKLSDSARTMDSVQGCMSG